MLISKEKSRQEFVPPLGKYVDLAEAEPLHNTNNAWQQWFSALLTMAMQYTDQAKLHTATVVLDLPNSSPLITFLRCVWETVKCGRPCNSLNRWFSGKRKKGISFSYRFTGLESKKFLWNFGYLLKELLRIEKLSRGSALKLHSLAFSGLQIRDAAAIYSRVEVSKQHRSTASLLLWFS